MHTIADWSRMAVLVSLLTAHLGAPAQRLDTLPAPRVGDKWTYRYTNLGDKREPQLYHSEVKRLQGRDAWIYGETQDPNASAARYWWRVDTVRGAFLERFDHDPNAPEQLGKQNQNNQRNGDPIQAPLEIGKKYELREHWPSGNGHTDWSAEVKALERLKTEAGEFDAYRIEYVGWWNRTAGNNVRGRAELTRWYAPAVKQDLKRIYLSRTPSSQPLDHNMLELVKWEPGPAN